MEGTKKFRELLKIVARLRHPEKGCPWDLKQTPKTLYPMMIEEAYEIVEAIEEEDWENLKEELGDLLLHVALQAQIAREKQRFAIEDILEEITDKLIRRHPHVFGDRQIDGVDEVLSTWDEIKAAEGKNKARKKYPTGLPSLQAADQILKEDPSLRSPREIRESLDRLLEDLSKTSDTWAQKDRDLLGEMLFSLAEIARDRQLNPEEILRRKVEEKILKEE